MPPRKIAEKSHTILELKPRRYVRKKTPKAKSLIEGKLKTPLIIAAISEDDSQDSGNAPQKITKPKLTKKVKINGIKPARACKGKLNKSQELCHTEEPYSSEDGPQKNRRPNVNKHNESGNEAIEQLHNPDVLLKNNKTKINEQNQYNIDIKDIDEVSAIDEVPNQNCAPTKIKKPRAPRTKKQIQKEIEIMVVDEAAISGEDSQDSGKVPQKIINPKLTKKVKINGIKPARACKRKLNNLQELRNTDMLITAISEEPYSSEDGPQKNRRPNVSKQNEIGDEAIEQLHNPDVLPKNNKTKINEQNQYNIDIKVSAVDEVPNQNCAPTKIKKPRAPRVKKQIQNEIQIMVVDEATDDAITEKVSKVKRRKTTDRQNQKKIQIIITNTGDTPASVEEPPQTPVEVSPKMTKTKPAHNPNYNDIKITLANEVIRNAFKKKEPIVLKPRRPARLRKNKTECDADDNVMDVRTEHNKLSDSHDTGDIQDVTKNKSLQKLSTLLDASQEFAICELPVTEKVPNKRRKLSLKRKTTADIDQTSQNNDINNEGKEGTQESKPTDNTATLLDDSIAPDSTSKPSYRTQSQKRSNLTCRKNSDSSESTCFSWTKDISSSSTVTCVTVKSNDFVRIDKKLPFVKLTNVNHQINRKKHIDNIFEENSLDSLPQKSKCVSECSSVSISNLNVSQTLNLSTSTLTSVTSNRPAQNNRANKENTDESIIKLQRSIDNLSSKIKKFDSEIINWIGYENDSNEVNIKNFHARIFDVLNEENEVIRYCKEIKQVLLGEQKPTEVIVECPNKNKAANDQNAVENLTLNNPQNNVTGDFEKQNTDIFKSDSKHRQDKDTEDNYDETINKRKSFDKNHDAQDNDDDDALSLFAESITGLESSRKNSSFAISVSNEKNVAQPDLGESLRINQGAIEPINNFKEEKESASSKVINIVKKQTADSSTVFNRVINNDRIIKFQTDNSGPSVNDLDNFSDHDDDLGVSYKRFQHISDIAVNNKSHKSLFSNSIELNDIRVRSPINTCESSSNRSPEFQNYRGRNFPYSLDNDSLNISQDLSGITGNNISENCNNKASLTQDNTNTESVEETRISNLGNTTVEQYDQSIANQLAMVNKQMYGVSNSIFKGLCIFNLVSKCKNIICNFPHKRIDIEYLRRKLKDMNDEMFIKETMYFLKWAVLKRTYGGCFVEECIRRNLTFWVLYLLKAFISTLNRNRRDEAFEIEITDATLLHLNEANLEPCTDILRSKTGPNICMCDHLMQAISVTQNFSRFKNVFIKLTLFICQMGRSFRLDVATQLLERLCILPYDDALARALLKIIAKTNPSIFNVSMMNILENQLSKNNTQLYKELMSLKLQAERYTQNLASPPMQSPHIASSNVGRPTSTPIVRADSPDTTNTDFVNKKAEPVITRTITINRTINTSNLNKSTGSESSEEPHGRYEPRTPLGTWRRFPPSLVLRPNRQVHQRLGFAPRTFNATHPRFRRRPQQEPY